MLVSCRGYQAALKRKPAIHPCPCKSGRYDVAQGRQRQGIDELLTLLQEIDSVLTSHEQHHMQQDKETLVCTRADKPKDDEAEYTVIQVEGVIDFASSRQAADVMGLTTDEGKKYTIVSVEAMDEYVRTFYKRRVIVLGKSSRDSSKIFLDAIHNTN